MTNLNTEQFLAHYGVKGMKWGQRKSSVSRRQDRQMNKQASQEFYSKKISSIFNEASRGGERVLIATKMPGDLATTIMTGKQFSERLMKGAVVAPQTTEVFARLNGPGTIRFNNSDYILNDKPIGQYKKQNFRKGS